MNDYKILRVKARNMFSKATLVVAIVLAGCNQSGLDNQIEKCVQAMIKANEPYKSEPDRSQMEAESRVYCLKAASGHGR